MANDRIKNGGSIFLGQSARIDLGSNPRSPADLQPDFMDVSGASPLDLVFSSDVRTAVETNVFTPLVDGESCDRWGIPKKRGILLAGPYGTGKTLTARVTANLANQAGRAFFYLDNVAHLDRMIQMAALVGPSVIFAEDLDQALGSERERDTNRILNAIDGIDTKSAPIMVVLTTNHVENIGQAMLRPGRLDAVIAMTPPDAVAAAELVELYAGDLLDPSSDLNAVGDALAGTIPAVIAEVVRKAKLGAIRRKADQINGDDLLDAAASMRGQLQLLEPRPEREITPVECSIW